MVRFTAERLGGIDVLVNAALTTRAYLEQYPVGAPPDWSPTYRWLPAKSTIASAFLMFYTRTPEGFRKVDDVVLEGGRLTVEDRTSGLRIILGVSRAL